MNEVLNNNTIETLNKGCSILRRHLDDIEFEFFLSILSREKFDYTKWQRNFYDKFDEGEVFDRAVKYSEMNGHTGKGIEV